jgi:hypothetical protein
MTPPPHEPPRTFSEQIETTGAQLVEQIKKLVAEGNAHTIRIKEPGGNVVLEINLTVGALAGGAVALALPWLAVIGTIAALVSHVSIEVVRDKSSDSDGDDGEGHGEAIDRAA